MHEASSDELQCIKILCLGALLLFAALLVTECVALLVATDVLFLLARLCVTVLYVLCIALKRYVQNDTELHRLPRYYYQPVLYVPMLMNGSSFVAHFLLLLLLRYATRGYVALLLCLVDLSLLCREHRAVARLLLYLEQQQFELPITAAVL
jgi:hypothetical protein